MKWLTKALKKIVFFLPDIIKGYNALGALIKMKEIVYDNQHEKELTERERHNLKVALYPIASKVFKNASFGDMDKFIDDVIWYDKRCG
jgi:hypothetical protein